MDMHILRSSDYQAPALTTAASALINVLKFALVNSQAARAITIARSGSTATVTLNNHNYQTGDLVLHAGADQAAYNIAARIQVIDLNNYTYEVAGSPATPATGSPTARKTGPGWTNPFNATDKAVLRMPGGNQRYLWIDETAGAQVYLRTKGFETMTGVDTGTNQFPSEAQLAGGLYQYKAAAGITPAWTCYATDRHFYFHTDFDNTAGALNGQSFYFGDIASYKAGDVGNTIIIGGTSTSQNSQNIQSLASGVNQSITGHYIARSYSQNPGSLLVGKHTDYAKQNASGLGLSGLTYPNPADAALYMAPLWIHETGAFGVLRGHLLGLWAPLHLRPLAHGDKFAGSGLLSGRDFEARAIFSSSQIIVETSPIPE